MANTGPLDPNQTDRSVNVPGGPGPTAQAGSSGTSPQSSPAAATQPAAQKAAAQTSPGSPSKAAKGPGSLAGVAKFFSSIGDEYRKDRELKREIKRAKALAQKAIEQDLTGNAGEKPAVADAASSEELLQQERNKRIHMISEFTDVRETFDHKIKRWIAGFACAVVPWLMVIFLTSDVGEYFAGQPFTTTNFKIIGIFGITALLEIVIAVVTNAWGNTVQDAHATEVAADKTKLRDRARTQGGAWAVLSLVSGFALFMFLMQQSSDNAAVASGLLSAVKVAAGQHASVDYTLNATLINVLLRVIGTLAVDPACVFAVHVTSRNLDQFLKQQNQITIGITQISESFDKQQEAAARAQMRQKENERFLELKGKMDDVNATMFGKMGEKMLSMSDQMFDQMQLPAGKVVDADDDDEGRNVRRIRR